MWSIKTQLEVKGQMLKVFLLFTKVKKTLNIFHCENINILGSRGK